MFDRIRQVVYPLFFLYYKLAKNKLNLSSDGQPLKMGISAVIAMRNEEFTIPYCLQSMIGFADQLIVIDNGSEDQSVAKARQFKEEFGHLIEVDILEMPGALLGDCREAGVRNSRYQWHLRWDADMIAMHSGENDVRRFRQEILKNETPRSIQFGYVNIYGDFQHTLTSQPVSVGEPYLMWLTRDIHYREFGKFDVIKKPFYYTREVVNKHYFFHCGGLKSDDNIIHRFHYFTWREWYNTHEKSSLPNWMLELNTFVEKRNQYLFGTADRRAVKFRFSRQFVQVLTHFDSAPYGGHPPLLLPELQNPRFEVVYEKGLPIYRKDHLDKEMLDYTPTAGDWEWSIDDFFNKLKTDHFSLY